MRVVIATDASKTRTKIRMECSGDSGRSTTVRLTPSETTPYEIARSTRPCSARASSRDRSDTLTPSTDRIRSPMRNPAR